MIIPNPQPNSTSPIHVAIIMDGNGRWAKQRNLTRIKGHRQGIENLRTIIKALEGTSVRFLTVYAFSTENWLRPESEVSALMQYLELFLRKYKNELIKQGIRLNAIGRLDELPQGPQNILKKTIKDTAHLSKGTLTLALNYSSRVEIVDATQALINEAQKNNQSHHDLDWTKLSQYLYTKDLPDPDLIIRTSGENRLSNFLLLQGAYAEIYFTKTFWPDFGKEEFLHALNYFKTRKRRFGKIDEQIEEEQKLYLQT